MRVTTTVPCYIEDRTEFEAEMLNARLEVTLGYDPSGPIATIVGEDEDMVAWLVTNDYEISSVHLEVV